MKVDVAYADKHHQIWLKLNVDNGADIENVIIQSGLLELVPELDIKTQKVGIFGKLSKLNTKVNEGDRIEVYRPIIRVLDDDDDDE